MAYQFITQYDSPNFTPQAQVSSVWIGQTRKLYASEGAKIAIHWWGDPNTNPSFEGVISTLCNPNRGASSHFIATGTGRRVACLVNMPDASWATNSANPFTFSIECDPRCRDEDYDVVAEVIAELRKEYGDLPLVPHRDYNATACPGNYDLNRLNAEARKKIAGSEFGTSSNPAPVIPVDSRPVWEKNFVRYPNVKVMYAIDNITPLRGFSSLNDVISNYRLGQPFDIMGETTIGADKYYLTKWSIENNKWNGFNSYELQDTVPIVAPPANPDPTVPNTTTPPTDPENVSPIGDRIDSVDKRLTALEIAFAALKTLVEKIMSWLTSWKG